MRQLICPSTIELYGSIYNKLTLISRGCKKSKKQRV
jgi:hypothetical protein